VYSLRARERPTVSTPVTWEEVEKTLKKKDASLLVFESKQTVARFEKMGDLFEPVLELKQRLPDVKKVVGGDAAQVPAAVEEHEVETATKKKSRSGTVKKTKR
jgi:DNA primase